VAGRWNLPSHGRVAAEFFSRAEIGERHYHLVDAVSALVLGGYEDGEIIDALAATYRALVPDDPKMIGLLERPASVRAGMAKRGSAVLPVSYLDRAFGDTWGVF
jgi:hypothetical protein